MPDPVVREPRQSQPLHRLLRAARALDPVRSGVVILPLSSGHQISPGRVVRVQSRPHVADLLASRLLVADPWKWRISALRTGPRIGGGHVRGDHPALRDLALESAARLPPLPPLPVDDGLELEVEYVGSREDGESFVACLCAESSAAVDQSGSRGQNCSESSSVVSFRAESGPVSRGERILLALPDRAHDLSAFGLTLRVADPSHWLVNDVLVGGDTLFMNSGDVPGELLADRPGRVPLHLGRLRAREDLVVQATYVGPQPSEYLAYEVSGTEVPAAAHVADTAFLPMSCPGTPINFSAMMQGEVGLPRGYGFLPEEVVLRDPEAWVVNDVRVGNASLFACSGDAPGSMFGMYASGCRLGFCAAAGGSNFTIVVTYAGASPCGAPIICGAVGRIVRLPASQGANI